MWALELLQKCGNFFGIIILHFVGCLLSSSSVGLLATSSKRTYAAHPTSTCCCPAPPWRHSNTHRQVWLSLLWGHCSFLWVLVHTTLCLYPPSISGGHGFDFKRDCTPPAVLLQLLLCPWIWGIFFDGFQPSPVNGCSAMSCNFSED